MSIIRLEAESMLLSGDYRVETGSFASTGNFIGLKGPKGVAATTFAGPSGYYDIVVGYYDEQDGSSQFTLTIDGTTKPDWSWTADNSVGGTRPSADNFTLRTVTRRIFLTNGSKLAVEGVQNQGENGRIDYLELVPSGSTNGAPTAQPDTYNTTEGKVLAVPVANGVLTNDSDPDNNPLSISTFDSKSSGGGLVAMGGDGAFTFTPAANFTGTDSFKYTVSDGNGDTATTTVNINVSADNSSPAPNTNPLLIEAESMILSGGYDMESKGFASGDHLIGLKKGSTGKAKTKFTGPTGYYDIVVGYHDEKDGKAKFTVNLDETTLDSWTGNKSPGDRGPSAKNFIQRTVGSGVRLIKGSSLLEVSGVKNKGELARFDYIKLIPSEPNTDPIPPEPEPVPPTDPSGSGVILNAQTGKAFSPIFGVFDTPKLMPLGDSITAGQHRSGAAPGGYRIQFWDRAVADGININFVGGESNTSGSLGDGDHEGHPGWKISQLANLVKNGQLSQHPADAILLMAGTNDVNSGSSANKMITQLGNLIDEVAKASPSTKLLVSSITPVDAPRGSASEAQNVLEFNALLPNFIDQKAAQGKQVFFVDAGGTLAAKDLNGDNSATSDLNDGLHPTAAGYKKLGNAWYDAVFNPETLADKTNLTGSEFSDWLIGNNKSNVFKGKGGRDKLTGGGGADKFVYDNPDNWVDEITDFSINDRLRISASGFGGSLKAGMTLDSSSFISGDNPVSLGSKSTFLYNTNENTLSFDRDGSGGGSEAAIATFSNNYKLQLNQIEII